SIAGFGDYEIAGISVPTLTTVNPFPGKIGTLTGDVILAALSGQIEGAQTIRIAPQLLLRQSSR
ncbi:MAG: substrate-binding domain-containing protein, partial [Pseudomonadota bacterium]